MRTSLFVVAIHLCVAGYAQEDSFPCQCCNPELKTLFQGNTLKSLYVHACYGDGLHSMSSSFLMPGGTAPKIVDHGSDAPDDSEYVRWTCRYSAGNLLDQDSSTAWAEGVDGYGIEEVVVLPNCLDVRKGVEIRIGYGKSKNLFAANSRPKKVKIIVIKAEYGGGTQYGTAYSNLSVAGQLEVTLRDFNGFQELPIPSFNTETYYSEILGEKTTYIYFLGLEILEVYKGAKYADTCISELRNTGN